MDLVSGIREIDDNEADLQAEEDAELEGRNWFMRWVSLESSDLHSLCSGLFADVVEYDLSSGFDEAPKLGLHTISLIVSHSFLDVSRFALLSFLSPNLSPPTSSPNCYSFPNLYDP